MKKNKKNIFNVAFLAVLCGLTFWMLLRGEDISQIACFIKEAKLGYLLLSVVFVIIFVCSESVIIHYMMHALSWKVRLHKCVKYSFIGFFFSCITPSASGGQPAQIYYMKKDGLEIPVSTLVLMIVTIGYKCVLIVLGLGIVFFGRGIINAYLGNTRYLLYLGIFLNAACVAGMLVLVFWPNLAKKIMLWGLEFLIRIKVLKKKESRREKLLLSMDKYHEAADFFMKHKLVIFNVLLISIFQRICLFFVTYLVYRSFGLSRFDPGTIVMLQAVISIDVDMLPLPGGMGISEGLFKINFAPIFTERYLMPGLLLSRGISYYVLVIMSAAITLFAHIRVTIREKKQHLAKE